MTPDLRNLWTVEVKLSDVGWVVVHYERDEVVARIFYDKTLSRYDRGVSVRLTRWGRESWEETITTGRKEAS